MIHTIHDSSGCEFGDLSQKKKVYCKCQKHLTSYTQQNSGINMFQGLQHMRRVLAIKVNYSLCNVHL
jgi:hypothetical protein